MVDHSYSGSFVYLPNCLAAFSRVTVIFFILSCVLIITHLTGFDHIQMDKEIKNKGEKSEHNGWTIIQLSIKRQKGYNYNISRFVVKVN